MHRHLAKMEGIIFEVVHNYVIWRLDVSLLYHIKIPYEHMQTYQPPTQLITFAKLGLVINLAAQLPCMEA